MLKMKSEPLSLLTRQHFNFIVGYRTLSQLVKLVKLILTGCSFSRDYLLWRDAGDDSMVVV